MNINIAVINNGFLGMVRQWQEFMYERNYSCVTILSPDFVKLAGAHGIAGTTVRSRAEVLPAVEEARKTEGPVPDQLHGGERGRGVSDDRSRLGAG